MGTWGPYSFLPKKYYQKLESSLVSAKNVLYKMAFYLAWFPTDEWALC